MIKWIGNKLRSYKRRIRNWWSQQRILPIVIGVLIAMELFNLLPIIRWVV